MARGRKPKPTELHILEGTYRDDRSLPDAMTASPVVQVPMPPKSLRKHKEAKELWYQVATELATMKVLSNADLVALEMYCQQVIIYRRATEECWDDKDKYLVKTTGSKGNEVMRMNQMFFVANEAFRKIMALGSELGLTPAARAKIGVRSLSKGDMARGLMRKR